ncbi:hypothetical protein FB157_14421 [Streptomyces sp. BK340]|nr:hypothetical protein FB157_14421 [Streptomyces sp. BK340]
MGQVHPAPEGDPHREEITECNLTAVWANFARRGCRRLICTNTVSVLSEATGMFERAMGAGVGITRVLLTASDATARERQPFRPARKPGPRTGPPFQPALSVVHHAPMPGLVTLSAGGGR